MKKSIIVAAAVVVLSVGGFSVYNMQKDDAKPVSQTTVQTSVPTQEKIVFSNEGKTVIYDGEQGKTALETAKSLTTVETQASSFGEFVTSINGVKADAAANYWGFYVNDQLASEGAGTYVAKPDDKIKWNLENL